MAKVFDGIDTSLAQWLSQQPMFTVATAPLAADGFVNVSPKGMAGTFAVLDPHRVGYLDLTGSGVETIAHLRENGRIVLMFSAFSGRPRIVRLHGIGRPVFPDDPGFADLAPRFSDHPGIRSVITVDLTRIADSCGYAVPLMDYQGDRDVLDVSNAHKGEEKLVEYRRQKNTVSLDGLPGLSSRQP